MINQKSSDKPSPSPQNVYSPSVPISVYRELAAELQATQTMLDSVHAQNQQLLRQNQYFRTEIDRLAQTVIQSQQSLAALPMPFLGDRTPLPIPAPQQQPISQQPSKPVAKSKLPAAPSKVASAKAADSPLDAGNVAALPSNTDAEIQQAGTLLFTGQDTTQPSSLDSDRSGEINGWWLILTIFLIVIGAFGAGFLIVRPLLQQNSR